MMHTAHALQIDDDVCDEGSGHAARMQDPPPPVIAETVIRGSLQLSGPAEQSKVAARSYKEE